MLKAVHRLLLFLFLVTIVTSFAVASDVVSSEIAQENAINIRRMWILMAACLVFLMQAGFLAFEVGCVRPKTVTSVAFKNVIDWIIVSCVFFLCGFGLMFGSSLSGWVGTDFFLLSGTEQYELGFPIFLFQLAFVGTSATIVSGAMSGRTGLISYLLVALFIGLFIYPIFGHWVWGNTLVAENQPLLASIGFVDFAGSTVVHSAGAWIGLMGVWILGPRLGRYDVRGNIQDMPGHWGWTCFGVLILWFGWWGFNGGSSLHMDEQTGLIITNTNISPAIAGVTGFFHCLWLQKKRGLKEKLVGSILGGLVSITACCHIVSPLGAIAVGAVAGIVHNYAYDVIIYQWQLDDPVGAIPVHGVCGVWGTLAVGIFGQSHLLQLPRVEQIAVQIVGIVACIVWTGGCSWLMFFVLRATVGLRVSPQEERAGIDLIPTPSSKKKTIAKVITEKIDIAKVTEEVYQVAVEKAGGFNLISELEFLHIPLHQRIALINQHKIQFLLNGEEIPLHEALEGLNRRHFEKSEQMIRSLA